MTPGDFILAHRQHPIARLISLAQARRFHGADAKYAHWSHAGVIDEGDHVIEAESRGIVRSPMSKYRPGEFEIVRLDAQLDEQARRKVVDYARTQIGQAFGFLDLAGATVYLLTGLPVRMVRKHHEICSSLVVRSLQEAGLLKELDPAITLPADLAKRFDVA